MYSLHPLPYKGILKVMPTDKSIAKIYKEISERQILEKKSLHGEMQLYGAIYIIMIYFIQKLVISLPTHFDL